MRLAAMGLAAALLVAGVDGASAHGGEVQLEQAAAGPYAVTVYTDPIPLAIGVADVSVIVLDAASGQAVGGARVSVRAEPMGKGTPGTFAAPLAGAYYAARVRLPAAGQWRFTVQIAGPSGPAQATFDAAVAPVSWFSDAEEGLVWALPVLVVAWLLIGKLRRRQRLRLAAL